MLIDCDWVDSRTVEIAADDRQPWQQKQFIEEIGELITELTNWDAVRRGRVNLTALYRPPSSSSSYGVPVGQFCDEFADLLDDLLLLPGLPII